MNTNRKLEMVRTPVEQELPMIDSVLRGTYKLKRRLGEGGSGEVFEAAHMRTRCEVAVKLLHRSLVMSAQALARFHREAEITSSLRHPHIVQVFDFNVTEQGVPYLVMELLKGRPLSSSVVDNRPLAPEAAFHIVSQIAQALRAAHEQGVVHLDLKPDNVMLLEVDGRADFVKVLDFGISQASWRARLTHEPSVVGTPPYMSPEQASGYQHAIDHRADQFSLAAIAYALLTGRAPFGNGDPVAVLYRVVHEQQIAPSLLVSALTEEVDAVIGRGMSKQATERYPDIMAFTEALGRALGINAVTPATMSPPESAIGGVGAWDADPATTRFARIDGADALPGSCELTERVSLRPGRRSPRGRRSGRLLLVLAAAAAALAWFEPPSRWRTHLVWHQSHAEARISRVVTEVVTRANHESSRPPEAVSMP